MRSMMLAGLGWVVFGWTAAPVAMGVLVSGLAAEESFEGYDEAFLNGQATSSTTGFAGDGTETWSGSSLAARGYNALPDDGLAYPGLVTSGGTTEAFRTTDFRDTSTHTTTLATATPITSIENDDLFLSFLINVDGYTARSNDHANNGVSVIWHHGTSSSPDIGVRMGGASGGDRDSALTLQILARNQTLVTDLILQDGTNLVVLGVGAHAFYGTNDAPYDLWLNPDLNQPIGPADWSGTAEFGFAANNASFGFLGFRMVQSFNFPQSVLVDELRFGSSFESVTPLFFEETPVVPEPSSALLALVGAAALLRARRRLRRPG